MVCDPPFGISLDSEWRDRAGLNKHGRAEASYMKQRTEGHWNTTISSDTRADWSDAFALAPSLQAAYVWHASKFTREVLDGLLRIGFLHHQQIIWNKGRTVLTRTLYWFAHDWSDSTCAALRPVTVSTRPARWKVCHCRRRSSRITAVPSSSAHGRNSLRLSQ